MKANKTICLDVKVIEKLKDSNASELINNLLIEYFKEDKLEGIKEEIENVGEKIEILQAKERDIKEEEIKKEKIEKLIIPDKLKKWYSQLEKRPDILQLDIYIKDNEIPKTHTLLEYLSMYDELKAISS